MATIWYSDTSTNGTTTSSGAYSMVYSGTTDTSTTSTNWAGSWQPYPRVVIKKVYVHRPKHWDRKIGQAWVKLVNDETNTGWKITATIWGDIEIHDPYEDVRDMKDFIGLLKARASAEDRKKIDAFFKKVGLEAKPKRRKVAKKAKK